MVTVEVKSKLRIGGKTITRKGVYPFLSVIADSFVEGTAIQLRIMAYELKDLIIDKLLAYQPKRGTPVLFREPTPRTGKDGKPPPVPKTKTTGEEPKTPTEMARSRGRKTIQPYSFSPPKVRRIPFRMQKLTEKYLDKKISKDLDPRILLASGDYVNGITVRKEETRGGGVIYFVTMANRKHEFSNIDLRLLARIMEFGTGEYQVPLFGDKRHMVTIKLPKRPHWRPAFKKVKEGLSTLGDEITAQATRLALQKLS